MRFSNRKSNRFWYRLGIGLVSFMLIAYALTGILLYFRQDYILYQANGHMSPSSPRDRDFQLDYQNIWIDVPNAIPRIHGWWFDAPNINKPIIAIPNEPRNILPKPKTILYLCGRGGSKTHYNNLARIQRFQQLGCDSFI